MKLEKYQYDNTIQFISHDKYGVLLKLSKSDNPLRNYVAYNDLIVNFLPSSRKKFNFL